MPNAREKLIDLIDEAVELYPSELERLGDHLIAHGVTVQEWIPVTERMPESNKWVLCACRANIIEVLKYDEAMDDWTTTVANRCYMRGFVTHWMPLPELPKEIVP